jgi:hypothetical protein
MARMKLVVKNPISAFFKKETSMPSCVQLHAQLNAKKLRYYAMDI